MLFKLVTIIFDVILNILANIVHFNTPSPKDCQLDRCVPLVVHGDGADSHRRRSFLVLTMGSLVVSGNFWDCKFLLYCLDESRVTPDTVSTLDLWCAWSMTELQLGSYMDKDPWGRSLAAFDTGKRQGLIAGGYKGILCYHKGDEKYHQKVYRASHGAVSRNVCVTCRATNDGDMVYTAHGINAIHRTTRLSTEEFITGVCGTRTWVGVPGWQVGMLCYDWLHVVDLPVIPEVAASCLVELTEESTFGHASTADERLRLAFVAFTKACKRAGVRNRGQMFSMLLGSCGSFFFPQLQALKGFALWWCFCCTYAALAIPSGNNSIQTVQKHTTPCARSISMQRSLVERKTLSDCTLPIKPSKLYHVRLPCSENKCT